MSRGKIYRSITEKKFPTQLMLRKFVCLQDVQPCAYSTLMYLHPVMDMGSNAMSEPTLPSTSRSLQISQITIISF